MKRLILAITILTVLLLVGAAFGQAKQAVLWRWVDGQGKVQYTDNFNSIPASSRATAQQGTFVPDKQFAPTTATPAPGTPPLAKGTNALEVFEERFSEKDEMLVVNGKVRNGFSQPIARVKIKITFFDASDNFIRSEITYIEPLQLQPGEEGMFKIEVPVNPNISYYRRDILME